MNRLYLLGIVFLIGVVSFFFKDFLLFGKLPIPSDTIVGLYHPFRDLYAPEYPRGIPFKNFLITDPVRQQYPWRELSVNLIKQGQIPLWNPYSLGGYPLLGNLQSAPFYPLNIIFLFLPFWLGWSTLIVLELMLASLFMYFFLKNLKLNPAACVLGALAFSFSGFSIAWLEWGTIVHTSLWLPLILLSIDKIVAPGTKDKNILYWSPVFVFSLIASFLAGHLQTFFYLFVVAMFYFFTRWIMEGKKFNTLSLFVVLIIVCIAATAIQWIPTIQLILESARNLDQINNWKIEGWFIPFKHLVQFIFPDFFGNPTTLNYWGVWNYGEFVAYIGIVPLLLTLFFVQDRRIQFLMFAGFLSLLFALPGVISALPYSLNIPLLSTSQPTRLLFIVDFSLAVIAAYGFNAFLNKKSNAIYYSIFILTVIIFGIWGLVLFGANIFGGTPNDLLVAKNNLFFPTGIFIISCILFLLGKYYNQKLGTIIIIGILCITAFDLLRFGSKFTPFTEKKYLFPQTKTISFLQKNTNNYRIMSLDDRILPPNFSVMYRLQSIDGYDPLYLRRYGELISASNREKPNIDPPFNFNRIITPKNYDSKIIDLLGVKYVLSLSDVQSSKLKKVHQEGETRVYENLSVFPRVFFVEQISVVKTKKESIEGLFNKSLDLKRHAIVELSENESIVSSNQALKTLPDLSFQFASGSAEIKEYKENTVKVQTNSSDIGFLVLTDTFYPTWRVTIDGKRAKIFRTDYNFRGVIVPKGNHTVEFLNVLFNF